MVYVSPSETKDMQQIQKESEVLRQKDLQLQRSGEIAVRTAVISHVIFILGVICVAVAIPDSADDVSVLSQLILLVCWNVLFGIAIIPAAHFCAWLSHQVFYKARMRVNRAVISMSIIAMLTINGWIYLSIRSIGTFPWGY